MFRMHKDKRNNSIDSNKKMDMQIKKITQYLLNSNGNENMLMQINKKVELYKDNYRRKKLGIDSGRTQSLSMQILKDS